MNAPTSRVPHAITDGIRGVVGRVVGVAPIVVAAVIVLLALVGPMLTTALGLPDHTASMLTPYAPPGDGHPLGGDYLGRDVVSRWLSGGRSILATALVATALTEGLAITIAMLRHFGRRAAGIISLALDSLVILPPTVVLLVIVTVGTGSTATTALAVAALSIPFSVRYLGAALDPVVNSGWVEAAELAGERRWRIATHHVLPHVSLPLLADAGLRFVTGLFLVSTAKFLGSATTAGGDDWASMIQKNFAGIDQNPWAVAVPALTLAALAVSTTLAAEKVVRHR